MGDTSGTITGQDCSIAMEQVAPTGAAAGAVAGFESLLGKINALSGKLGGMKHGENCGNEEVFYGEGVSGGIEFVCNCDYEHKSAEIGQEIGQLEGQASEIADANGIYTKDALHIHERRGNLERQLAAAQHLGLLEMQLELLERMKRLEEGVELAIKHGKTSQAMRFLEASADFPRLLSYAQEQKQDGVAVKTLIRMGDIEGALRYAEEKAMHQNALDILRSQRRIGEAVKYAERHGLHDKALGLLEESADYEGLFEYGAKHNCREQVKKQANRLLENLLGRDYGPRHSEWVQHPNVPLKAEDAASQAYKLCTAMEKHQLPRSAALYREVVEEFTRRMQAKERVKECEKSAERGDQIWFVIADWELSLGNLPRYRKIWEETKRIYQQGMRPMPSDLWGVRHDAEIENSNKRAGELVSSAQDMLDNPRYHSLQEGSMPVGSPQLGYPAALLLGVALPLAELLEAEGTDGKKRFPSLSLQEVVKAWGASGMQAFFGLPNADSLASSGHADGKGHYSHGGAYRGYLYYESCYCLSQPGCLEASGTLKNLAVALETISSPEALTFLAYHYPHLFRLNEPKGEGVNVGVNGDGHVGVKGDGHVGVKREVNERGKWKKIKMDQMKVNEKQEVEIKENENPNRRERRGIFTNSWDFQSCGYPSKNAADTDPSVASQVTTFVSCPLATNGVSATNENQTAGERKGKKTALAETFSRLGWLLEHVLQETSREGESSPRKKTALENILHVPAAQLTKENIFTLETGGPDAVWKHLTASEKPAGGGQPAGHETAGHGKPVSHFLEPRLREIQQVYPRLDEASKKKMKRLFFEAYTSAKMTKSLDRALKLYTELRQAYGRPALFPADHPLSFLRTQPNDERGRQNYALQVMQEIYSVPNRRKQVAEAALERELPDFFEEAFNLDISRLQGSELREVSMKLTEFLNSSPQQLDAYLRALERAKAWKTPGLFFSLDAAAIGENKALPHWSFLQHYDQFAAAILAESSSLAVPGILSQHFITTARPQGKKAGIRERLRREVDAIAYLFREVYKVAQTRDFKEKADYRAYVVSSAAESWKEKQKEFLAPEVADTIVNANFHFNFNRFFWRDEEIQRYLVRYLVNRGNGATAGGKKSIGELMAFDGLFSERPELLFSRIMDPGYYIEAKEKRDNENPGEPRGLAGKKSRRNNGISNSRRKSLELSDGFINALNRLKNGLSTSWTFDELRCEFNETPLRDFFNNAAECTGNGGKYQRFGYAHLQDRNIGIIAANLYEAGKYKSTVGKAFLARCKDHHGNLLLYVDGVVMLQDVADFLEEPRKEARWMPLCTKAILRTALEHGLNEIVFNASHKLAQRSVWQYLRHVALLLGLEESRDFTYGQGRVDDGNAASGVNVKTMSAEGFELAEEAAARHWHYLEKVKDESYIGKHLLEGFWINHYESAEFRREMYEDAAGGGPASPENGAPAGDKVSQVPAFITPLEHSEIPQINDGRGSIIGFRLTTGEWLRHYNEKYGKEYGVI